MVNLYTLPTYVIVLFIGVILCLFLANSVLYYYLMPQAQFRQLGRKCLEGSSLLLLMAVATILYEVYTDSLNGIVYDEATDFWRYSTALAGTAGAVYWIHDRQAGSLWVLAASILLLPVFDDWLPGSLVLALVCLAWRLIRLFPRTYNQYQQRLTARSIQTAVDCLDEGILISWEKGEPVLVNFTMYAVMEQLVGTVVRNANIFWHLLPFLWQSPRPFYGTPGSGSALSLGFWPGLALAAAPYPLPPPVGLADYGSQCDGSSSLEPGTGPEERCPGTAQ